MSFVVSPYSRNVYVASLPMDYTDDQLRTLFEPFGRIVSCAVKRDRATGVCKGYGFVLFEREEDACNAVIGLQGHSINFTRIQVRLARPEASAKKLMPIVAQQQALLQAMQQSFLPYCFPMMPPILSGTSVVTQ